MGERCSQMSFTDTKVKLSIYNQQKSITCMEVSDQRMWKQTYITSSQNAPPLLESWGRN